MTMFANSFWLSTGTGTAWICSLTQTGYMSNYKFNQRDMRWEICIKQWKVLYCHHQYTRPDIYLTVVRSASTDLLRHTRTHTHHTTEVIDTLRGIQCRHTHTCCIQVRQVLTTTRLCSSTLSFPCKHAQLNTGTNSHHLSLFQTQTHKKTKQKTHLSTTGADRKSVV